MPKKAVKEAQEALDRAVVARYPKLTEGEIKQLLVEDKWRASLQAAIEAEIERITSSWPTASRSWRSAIAPPCRN